MGIFSSVKKVIKKATSPITKSLSAVKNVGSGALNKIKGFLPEDLNSVDDVWNLGKSVLGGSASSALELAGAKAGYDMQLKAIQEQNASAKEIAQKQMDFQKEMSNTAHQREITDLKAAGLNPILSGTGGMGASTPAGASAPVRSEGDAVSSAFQIFKTIADVMKTNADREFVQQTQTPAVQASTQKTQAETKTVGATHDKIRQEISNLERLEKNLEKQGKLTDAQEAQVQKNIEKLKQEIKHLRMIGEVSDTEYGKLMEYAKRATQNVSELPSLMNAAKSLFKKR